MSRAFVKEIDDAPPPPLPERPISSAANLVTPRGRRLIDEAIIALEAKIAETEDAGAAAELARDLRYWRARKASMQVHPRDPDPEAVAFGVRVSYRRGGRPGAVTIVGEDEADPAGGRIAWTAPLARALGGAEPGDVVTLERGGESEEIEVLAVEPGDPE